MMLKTRDMPILDLRQWPLNDIAQIDQIVNVRTVVLSSEALSFYLPVPKRNVRSHVLVEKHEELFIGQVDLNDAFLASLPEAASIVVLGHLFIEGAALEAIAGRIASLRIYGQIFYASLPALVVLQARCRHHQGQTLAMPAGAQRWIGPTTLNLERLVALGGAVDIVSIGPLVIAPEVTPKAIHQGLRSLIAVGELSGNRDNVCALMGHCMARLGTITIVN